MTRSEIVGRNIYKYRTAIGMSQIDFAESIGRSQTMVSMYEKGQRLPSTQIMSKIAEVLGVTFGDIYYAKDENKTDKYDWYEEAFPTTNMTDDEKDLWQMREDIRRNPELRTLFDLQRKATKSELRQMEAFIRAIRSSNDHED